MVSPNRWSMLAVGTAAQTAGTVYLYGLPVLIPALRATTGFSLWQLGILVACPSLGMALGVFGWGVFADRHGERVVVLCGLFGGAALLIAAAYSTDTAMAVVLVLAGAAGSALYASSGRIVVGWFPPRQRGVAMGIRQTSQPLGVALAAAVLPSLAGSPPAVGPTAPAAGCLPCVRSAWPPRSCWPAWRRPPRPAPGPPCRCCWPW